jgi:hypothetical protein
MRANAPDFDGAGQTALSSNMPSRIMSSKIASSKIASPKASFRCFAAPGDPQRQIRRKIRPGASATHEGRRRPTA